MAKNKVTLHIAGMDYIISSEDSTQYMKTIGADVDKRISEMLKTHNRLSTTQAAVMTALELADEKEKCVQSSENLRSQIQEYLEDSAKSKTDAELLRRENERLNKEILRLRNQNSGGGVDQTTIKGF